MGQVRWMGVLASYLAVASSRTGRIRGVCPLLHVPINLKRFMVAVGGRESRYSRSVGAGRKNGVCDGIAKTTMRFAAGVTLRLSQTSPILKRQGRAPLPAPWSTSDAINTMACHLQYISL
jgi:hypothetical protein